MTDGSLSTNMRESAGKFGPTASRAPGEACPLCGHETYVAARFGAASAVPDALGLRGRALRACRRCGLGRLVPPYDSDRLREFYETEYRAVVEGRSLLYRVYLSHLATMTAGRRLLDVGCGDGDFLVLARAEGWEALGVELRRGAAEAGAARGLRIFEREVPAGEGQFDVITLWNVLDQMPEPLAEARSLVGRLAPGGVLFARVPNLTLHLWTWRVFNFFRPGRCAPGVIHPFAFTARSLRLLLSKLGLHVEFVEDSALSGTDASGTGARLLRRVFSLLTRLARCFGFYGLASSLVAAARKPGVT